MIPRVVTLFMLSFFVTSAFAIDQYIQVTVKPDGVVDKGGGWIYQDATTLKNASTPLPGYSMNSYGNTVQVKVERLSDKTIKIYMLQPTSGSCTQPSQNPISIPIKDEQQVTPVLLTYGPYGCS